MKKSIQTLFLFCLFLSILEVGSRALLGIKSIDRIVRQGHGSAIRRWKWTERHQHGMPPAVPYDRYDPTKGWELKPNISSRGTWGDNQVLHSNSRGIRGQAEHSYIKNKGRLRILCLGDSFTFGEGVSDSETYPHYLQQMLPDAEVINMGVHGYGHDQMLIYLKEEGVKYQPDIVILGFLSQDSDRNMMTFGDYAKPRFKLADHRLKLCNVPVPSPDMTLRQGPWRSKFLDLLSLLQEYISDRTGAYAKEREAVTNAILKEMATTTEGIGAVPIFAYLDHVRDKESDFGAIEDEKIFLDKCEDLSVKCVFLRQGVYSARLSGIKIKDKAHFDPKTNQLVALGIKEYLLRNGLLDRKSQGDALIS
ncbi:MAG: hypothetical protein ABH891_09985 [Candidatus Omnitrophota bacterium]